MIRGEMSEVKVRYEVLVHGYNNVDGRVGDFLDIIQKAYIE